jgi:tyrosine-protein kinase Etk/Wzc
MSDLPASRALQSLGVLPSPAPFPEPSDELRPNQIWRIVRRNWWVLFGGAVIGIALAELVTRRTVPLYQAAATLRVTDGQEVSISAVYRQLSPASEIPTEATVLRSRTLAEEVVGALALQLRLGYPRGAVRSQLFDSIRVAPHAFTRRYQLVRQADGRFDISPADSGPVLATALPGQTVTLGDGRFRLKPDAAKFERIDIALLPRLLAAEQLVAALRVEQPSPAAKMLVVSYVDTDRELVWQVPNSLVERFIEQRQQQQRSHARSTVAFLRSQLDTIARQLSLAENEVRVFRERFLVVDPQAEATGQVSQMIALQTERGSLDGERAALASFVNDVEDQAKARGPEDPSPYRKLLAFPTLLRSAAAADLLQTLSRVEDERAVLLARRTPADPDVRDLTSRATELENQLRSVVGAYLQGLATQITSIDGRLNQFNRRLSAIPNRELEYARLDRKPRVLGEIYSLLQTRLKEAEIAEAAQDASVQLVDGATPPRWPVKPRRLTNLFTGLILGLLLAAGMAIVRELRDGAVRSRADVQIATGLPVVGLIPRISRGRGRNRLPLITEKRLPLTASSPPSAAAAAPPRRSQQRRYTFLAADTAGKEQGVPELEPPPREPRQSAGVVAMGLSEAGGPVAEAYGILQTNIAFADPEFQPKVLVITSPLAGDGKTTSAVNLAISFAERGASVLLIDADLRRGTVHLAFEAPPKPGLSDVLQGSVAFSYARHEVDIDGHPLHYLTRGSAVLSPAGLLESEALKHLIERLRGEYDVIVLDSPPANVVADAVLLAVHADGVLVVVRSGRTESAALAHMMEQLRHVRARVLGAVINGIDFRRDAIYDGAYRYHDYGRYVAASDDERSS